MGEEGIRANGDALGEIERRNFRRNGGV